MSTRLTEDQIADSFHSYLKSSLTQAKIEKLVDTDLLTSAESDVMITGPALCLYFAALRCTTDPPSVPLPRSEKSVPGGPQGPALDLSFDNCPTPFIPFLTVWANNVPRIQTLSPEHQHDLARIICNLEPISQPLNRNLNGIAAELRAVAIDISQRRSFQDRYAGDLQAAIDAGETSSQASGSGSGSRRGANLKVKASFVPPPMYDPSPSSSPGHSPQPSPRLQPSNSLPPENPPPPSVSTTSPRLSVRQLSPTRPLTPRTLSPNRPITPISPSTSTGSRTPPSPSFLASDTPAIQLIRETLYAALAEVLATHPALHPTLLSDPPRAYFSAVALAILSVALTSMTSSGSVIGVLGAELGVAQCPPELRPFMVEMGRIRAGAKGMEEEDNDEAVRRAQHGKMPKESRMERVEQILEQGVSYHRALSERQASQAGESEGRRSIEGRAATFANRVSALALGMTRLKAFRERQAEVFKILTAVVGTEIPAPGASASTSA